MGNKKMVNLKKSIVATGVMLLMVETAQAKFVEDSSGSLGFRNFYVERDFEDPNAKNIGSWSQAVMGRFESGYTDTPLQIGVDLSAQYAYRLGDRNVERLDTIIPYDVNKKEQVQSYGKYGATLKLKYKDTELKIGELLPRTPVAVVDDSRQLVTTYAGAMLESKAIKDLKISAGRLTHINSREDDDYEKISLFAGNAPRYESDGLNFIGFDYNFNPSVTGAYWYGQLEDIYQQHYANLAYSTKVGDTNIKIDGRYFHNSEVGDEFYGKIDSQSLGVMTTIQTGNHLLMTGVRKNTGESVFPTLSGYAPQPFLHAWSNLGFVKPGELTWHVWYTYNFKDLGVNGLSATARYLHGTDIERQGFEDNKETEKSIALKYVVPEGKLKGLGLDVMHIRTDQKYAAGYSKGPEWNENRVILTYNYKF